MKTRLLHLCALFLCIMLLLAACTTPPEPCKETDSGFGLANVNERIQMNYGTEYGVTINSKQGEGTWVQVVIPAWSVGEDSFVKERTAEGE